MIQDAEKFADEDKKLKEGWNRETNLNPMPTHLKIKLMTMINSVQNWVTRIKKIEESVNEKISWLEENQEADAEDFKAQKKELEDTVQPIIAKLYQQGGEGGSPPPEDEDYDKDEL